MLCQLIEEEPDLIVRKYELLSLRNILKLVAKFEKKELKDATVTLTVDGVHNLMDMKEDEHNQHPEPAKSRKRADSSYLPYIPYFSYISYIAYFSNISYLNY